MDDIAHRMRRDWDRRARENALYYVADSRQDWSEEEFFASGISSVSEHVLTDMVNICQGRDPGQMRVLEIGCGVGRVTHALAKMFGEVHAIDISAEMVRRAKCALESVPNVFVHQNDGMTVDVVAHLKFQFAFSMCVFHHVPDVAIIESYLRSINKVLVSGALFKFEVQGCMAVTPNPTDTWVGAPVSDLEAVQLAERSGFEARFRHGAGQERFWLWFFKRESV